MPEIVFLMLSVGPTLHTKCPVLNIRQSILTNGVNLPRRRPSGGPRGHRGLSKKNSAAQHVREGAEAVGVARALGGDTPTPRGEEGVAAVDRMPGGCESAM